VSNKVSYTFIAQDLYSKVAKKIVRVNALVNKSFKKVSERTTQTLRRVRQQVNKTGRAIAKFSGRSIAVLGAAATFGIIKFGSDFQAAMADVSAITGATGKDLQFFSDESLRLAKTSITAQSEVAKAFKIIASAKSELLKDPKGLSRVTEQVLLLKNASGIELAEAAKVTTEALNQFGAGADQAARFVNVLAAGAKVGASEVGETGRAVIDSAVFAKKAGLSFEQLNSTIQVLAKNGIKGAKAGIGLRTVFLRLESSGKKKLMPSVVGLNKALENLQKLNLTTKESTTLFGTEAAAVGDILISNRLLVDRWTKAITGTNSAQEQATKRMATFQKKAEKLGIIIKDVLIRIFLRLEPTLSKIADRMAEFVGSITQGDIDKMVTKFENILVVVSAVGATVGAVFKTIGVAIGESLGAIVVFIEKVERALESLGKFIKKIDLITPAGKLIGEAVAKIEKPIVGLFSKDPILGRAGRFLGETIGELQDATGGGAPEPIGPINTRSQTDINVNLRAQENQVESMQTRSRGNVKNLNVGLNMAPAIP